jgi:hypothetical protein
MKSMMIEVEFSHFDFIRIKFFYLDRLESWVQIPTRNIRRGGWRRQYAVIAKNKLLLYNSEKDQLAAISIDVE